MTVPGQTESARIAVVGAGPIGLLFAARLGSTPLDGAVTVVTRRPPVRLALESHGIRVVRNGAAGFSLPRERLRVVGPDEDVGSHDLVVVACRSGESRYALTTAAAAVAEHGTVVVVQNGLRAWDAARDSGHRCLCGATYEIVHATSPSELVWTRVGRTEIAVPESSRGNEADVRRVVHAFETASLDIRIGESEADVLWRKLVLTTPNWIAAAVGAPLYAVVESPSGLQLLAELVREISAVAAADGVELDQAWAAAEFAALRGSGSVGSAFAALSRGGQLEVVDICLSVVERGRRIGAATARTESLLRLGQVQQEVFAHREGG